MLAAHTLPPAFMTNTAFGVSLLVAALIMVTGLILAFFFDDRAPATPTNQADRRTLIRLRTRWGASLRGWTQRGEDDTPDDHPDPARPTNPANRSTRDTIWTRTVEPARPSTANIPAPAEEPPAPEPALLPVPASVTRALKLGPDWPTDVPNLTVPAVPQPALLGDALTARVVGLDQKPNVRPAWAFDTSSWRTVLNRSRP